MKRKYILPDFTYLTPKKIDDSIRIIKRSKLYNPDIEMKPHKDKFEAALKKLINNEELYKKDYKILIYYIDSLENRGYFNKFYTRFNKDLSTLNSLRSFISPFASYMYNSYDGFKNTDTIYKMFKSIEGKIDNKEKYKNIRNKLKSCSSNVYFLNKVKTDFKNIKNQIDIETATKSVFMKTTDKFYYECIKEFIIINYLDENLWDFIKRSFNSMDLKIKKSIVEAVLLKYKGNFNINSYPDRWFKLILEEFKDPYGPLKNKWNGISDDAREVFRVWNNNKNLYDFFENRVEGGDRARLKFWKQYINEIYRIEYFADLQDALVMEFKSHVFIEFAKKGNALYMYSKKVIDIEYIKDELRRGYKSTTKKMQILKDKNRFIDKINHAGSWEDKFETQLWKFGYKKSRW